MELVDTVQYAVILFAVAWFSYRMAYLKLRLNHLQKRLDDLENRVEATSKSMAILLEALDTLCCGTQTALRQVMRSTPKNKRLTH